MESGVSEVGKTWLLHIDEPTRALIHIVLKKVAVSLFKLDNPVWAASKIGNLKLHVPRAVTLQGRKRTAELSLSKGGLQLTIPGKDRPGPGLPFMVWGVIPELEGPNDPKDIVLRTLAFWCDGLAEPLNPTREREADQYRSYLRALGVAVIVKLTIPWRWLSVSPSRDGHHEFFVLAGEPSKGFIFKSYKDIEAPYRMSESLSEELDRLAADRIHVVEEVLRHDGELPMINIGSPSGEAIYNDERIDAMAILRAIAATPSDFSLLTPAVPVR